MYSRIQGVSLNGLPEVLWLLSNHFKGIWSIGVFGPLIGSLSCLDAVTLHKRRTFGNSEFGLLAEQEEVSWFSSVRTESILHPNELI